MQALPKQRLVLDSQTQGKTYIAKTTGAHVKRSKPLPIGLPYEINQGVRYGFLRRIIYHNINTDQLANITFDAISGAKVTIVPASRPLFSGGMARSAIDFVAKAERTDCR